MKFCFHRFVDGFGGMGDGLVCVKCNHFTYSSAPISLMLGRVVKNDGTFMHQDTFPFVVRFDKPCYLVKDLNSFTHYFNMSGELTEERTGRVSRLSQQ